MGDVQPARLLAGALLNASDAAKDRLKIQTARRAIRRFKQGMVPPERQLNFVGPWTMTGGDDPKPFLRHDSGQNARDRVVVFATDESLRALCRANTWYTWMATFPWRQPCLSSCMSFVLRSAQRAFRVSTPCCRGRPRLCTPRCWRLSPITKSSCVQALRNASLLRENELCDKLNSNSENFVCHRACVSAYCSQDHIQRALERKRKAGVPMVVAETFQTKQRHFHFLRTLPILSPYLHCEKTHKESNGGKKHMYAGPAMRTQNNIKRR